MPPLASTLRRRTAAPVAAVLLSLLPAAAARGSLIADRAPNARAVAEIFVDERGARVEWELREGPEPALAILLDPVARPERISIAPPPGVGAEEIGFVLYHLGMPVTDAHYLAREEVAELNWDDPWRSRFLNPRLRRLYESPLGVFLHVGRYEVRVEIVGRPADLGIARIDPEKLPSQIASALNGRWRLTIDGEPAQAPLDRCQFLERRLRATEVIEAPPPGRVRSSTLGVVYRVRRTGWPRTAGLRWDYYPPPLERLSAALTEDFTMTPAVLRPGQNELTWQRPASATPEPAPAAPPPPAGAWEMVIPWIGGSSLLLLLAAAAVSGWRIRRRRPVSRSWLAASFALAGIASWAFTARRSAVPDGAEASAIVSALLENVYRAYDCPTDEEIYEALGRGITGDFLTEAYLQVRRALEVERTGGAMVKVSGVTLDAAGSLRASPYLFETNALWTVAGAVAHWGHVHNRLSRFSGQLTVVAEEGVWKIQSITLTNEERLPTRPGFTAAAGTPAPPKP
jgi:hypothetical protein